MKYFILALLFVTSVFAQQYVQKQDTQIINILANAGFESGKTGWLQTTPANVTVVSGTDALFGAASVKFEATSGTEVFRSALITVPAGLKGKECHAVVNYATNDINDTPYVASVMDASGTVLATKDLDAKIVMGVPTDLPTSVTIDGWECPTDKQIQLRVENSALGDWVKLDNMHLGSKTGGLGNAADIANALGYTPADDADLTALEGVVNTVSGTANAVSASVSALDTATLKKADNLSDVASATVARTNLGLGSVATESTVPVTKGGTGLTSVGASGTVLTSNASGTAQWIQPEKNKGGINYLENPSFEQGLASWVASGTLSVSQAVSYSLTSLPSVKGDDHYAAINTSATTAELCNTFTIPTNNTGDLEISGRYTDHVSAPVKVTVRAGSNIVSQTFPVSGKAQYTGYNDYKMFMATGGATTGTICLGSPTGTVVSTHDDIYVGSVRSMATGAIVGPWTNCTVTGTWTTNTTYTCKSRQNGDSKEYEVLVSTSGAPTATQLFINLPSGDVVDLNKTTSPSTAYYNYGLTDVYDSSASHYSGGVGILNSTQILPVVFNAAGTYSIAAGVTQVSPITFGAADTVLVKFKVPIVGLQASGVIINGGNSAYRGVKCYKNGGVVNATSYFASWTSCSGTSAGSFNLSTGEFTADVQGDYNYTVCVATNLTTVQPYITLNGTGVDRGQAASNGGTCFSGKIPNVSAGQKLAVYNGSGSSLTVVSNNTDTFVSFERASVDGIVGTIGQPPTVQRFTSGSGTYTTPAGVKYIIVEMVGGGGGGSGTGSSSSGGTGGTGGTTTFGSSLLTANGGVGGDDNVVYGGIGGTAVINSPAIELRSKKGMFGGARKTKTSTTDDMAGGQGGDSSYGMGGSEEGGSNSGWSGEGYGAGGGGGGTGNGNTATAAGAGGGAGGELRALINNPSSTYSYSIGAAGAAGTAGTSGVNGGAGSGGIIIVTEYY